MAESRASHNDIIPVYAVKAYTAKAANAFEYAGVSVTIPANCVYSLAGTASYSNALPLGAALSKSESSNAAFSLVGLSPDGCSQCSCSGQTGSSPITLYLWVKYGAANTNNARIEGWYKSL